MKFSIRDLLLVTFWAAVLTAVLLDMWRLYPANDWRPWYSPDKQGAQFVLNLCVGTAASGIVGCFSPLRWRGPIIGMAIALVAAVTWAVYVAYTVSGVG